MAPFFSKLLMKIFQPLSEFLNKRVESENEKIHSKVQSLKDKLGPEYKAELDETEKNLDSQIKRQKRSTGKKGNK